MPTKRGFQRELRLTLLALVEPRLLVALLMFLELRTMVEPLLALLTLSFFLLMHLLHVFHVILALIREIGAFAALKGHLLLAGVVFHMILKTPTIPELRLAMATVQPFLVHRVVDATDVFREMPRSFRLSPAFTAFSLLLPLEQMLHGRFFTGGEGLLADVAGEGHIVRVGLQVLLELLELVVGGGAVLHGAGEEETVEDDGWRAGDVLNQILDQKRRKSTILSVSSASSTLSSSLVMSSSSLS